MIKFLPSVYLGWSLGSNHGANVFGPQVHSGIIRYRNAVILAAAFIAVGAVVEGQKCFSTVAQIGGMVPATAVISTLAAAVTVNLMSYLGLPVSTSQAIIGSIIGLSLARRNSGTVPQLP